jgi:hypothetical protein
MNPQFRRCPHNAIFLVNLCKTSQAERKHSSAYLRPWGLVVMIYDELGIGNISIKNLPKPGQYKLAHSVIAKAMILYAFGFNERLLNTSRYFSRILTPGNCGMSVFSSKIDNKIKTLYWGHQHV